MTKSTKIVQPVDSNFEGGDSPQETVAREAWRMLGIMSEFVDATERLANIRPAVSIFGSARVPRDHAYYALSENIARLLSDSGFAVLSGGGPGLMEAVNKGAFEGRSPAVGLNIELPHEQFGNAYQDVTLSFRHFFARKTTFIRFSCAYVVMPGGFGTLDELSEALTIIQTGKSMPFPVILVCSDFWKGLLAWFEDKLVGEGMIGAKDMRLMQVVDRAEEVVDVIFDHYRNRSFAPSPSERESFLKL